MLWDLIQQSRIESLRRDLDSSRLDASKKNLNNQADIIILQDQIDMLTLACHSMWELLSEKHGITEEQLRTKINEVDLRDGTVDGKMDQAETVSQCPECKSPIRSARANCFMCGAKINSGSPFQR